MSDIRWMIYGATGYTGRLVAEEAVRRGHRPILGGRSIEKLEPLARRLGLEYAAFYLDDINTIAEAIADVDIVYHAAGPFIHTSDQMIRACLATGTHYLDLSGEISIFENTFSYDEAARKNGIVLLSGAGFDVIPTDCMAKYVADQVPGATSLEIGIDAIPMPTAGTAKSFVEMVPGGGYLRRNGELEPYPLGKGAKSIHYSHGTYKSIPVPWGDLSVAYRSTGVPNITTYMALNPVLITLGRLSAPIGKVLFRPKPVRGFLNAIMDRIMTGPSDTQRELKRSYVWAKASNAHGQTAEAWLETLEAYKFTVIIGVRAVEHLADSTVSGALTPSMLFGPDFVLEADDTFRLDSL